MPEQPQYRRAQAEGRCLWTTQPNYSNQWGVEGSMDSLSHLIPHFPTAHIHTQLFSTMNHRQLTSWSSLQFSPKVYSTRVLEWIIASHNFPMMQAQRQRRDLGRTHLRLHQTLWETIMSSQLFPKHKCEKHGTRWTFVLRLSKIQLVSPLFSPGSWDSCLLSLI